MSMEEILQTSSQMYEKPTHRNMRTTDENCQVYVCHETQLCQHYNGPHKRQQEIHKTVTRKQEHYVQNYGTKSKQQHILQWYRLRMQYRSGNQLYRTPSKTTMHLKTNKTTLKTHPVPSPRSSKSQQINTKYIQGTKPSCIPVPNHAKSDSKTSHSSTVTHQPNQALLCDQALKLLCNQQYPHWGHLQPTPILSTKEKHHYYQLHQHQLDNFTTATITNNTSQDHQQSTTEIPLFQDHRQSFQDHHLETTTDSTRIHTSQDHTLLNSTPNDHHYFQDHHTNTRTSSQDHTNSINRHKDTSSQDHTSSINSHTDTVHSQYTTYIFPYHTTPHEDSRNTGFIKHFV